MTAIFGVFLFLDRQTGGMVRGLMLILYPLPITVYTAKYGLRTGIPAAIAMALISFLLGSVTLVFYAVSELLVGLLFGTCLYRRLSPEKTLFAVMIASAVLSLVEMFFLAFVTGVPISKDVEELETMVTETFTQFGMDMYLETGLFSGAFLKRILILSTIFGGLIQGFLIYEGVLLIARKLKIHTGKLKSLYEFRPPRWTAFVAAGLFVLYFLTASRGADGSELFMAGMTVGMIGYLYLVVFGGIGISWYLKNRWPEHKALPVLLGILSCLVLPYLALSAGFFYLCPLKEWEEDL